MQGSVGSTMTDRTGTYLIQLQLANYNTRKSAEKKKMRRKLKFNENSRGQPVINIRAIC